MAISKQIVNPQIRANLQAAFIKGDDAFLPYEEVFIAFERQMYEYLKLEEEAFKGFLEQVIFQAELDSNAYLLELAWEELPDVPVDDGSNGLLNIADVAYSGGGIDSVAQFIPEFGPDGNPYDPTNDPRVVSKERDLLPRGGDDSDTVPDTEVPFLDRPPTAHDSTGPIILE